MDINQEKNINHSENKTSQHKPLDSIESLHSRASLASEVDSQTSYDRQDKKHPVSEKSPKKICWIICRNDTSRPEEIPQWSYSIKRFIETFQKNDLECHVIYASDIDILITSDRGSILVDGKLRRLPTFVLARTGAQTDFYTLAVYRHLEKLSVPVINCSEAIVKAKDKLFTLQILAQKHLPVPKTFLLRHPVNTKYITKVVGLPVVIKLLSGMQGNGVFIAHTHEELKTYCDMLGAVSPLAQMIFQECITTSISKDLRILVIGGKVIGAMKRSNEHDFRANIHRGGIGHEFKLPANAEFLALSAARILGLDIAGVDLLFDNEEETEFKICEVNSSPGFEGFEKAVHVDVPLQILSYIRVSCSIPP